MNVQDLETLVRYRQNVVTQRLMVWADGEYGLIKWKQQNHFDGRHSELAFEQSRTSSCWRGPPASGSVGLAARTPDPDVRCRGSFGDGRTLDEAFRQPGCPALLAVPVDYGENVKLQPAVEGGES